MSILSIDIGTTTITALLLDEKSGEVVDKATLKNDNTTLEIEEISMLFVFGESIFALFPILMLINPLPCGVVSFSIKFLTTLDG